MILILQSGPTAPSNSKSGKSGLPYRVRRKLNEPWVEDDNGQLGYGRYNVPGYSNDFGHLDILSEYSSKSGSQDQLHLLRVRVESLVDLLLVRVANARSFVLTGQLYRLHKW